MGYSFLLLCWDVAKNFLEALFLTEACWRGGRNLPPITHRTINLTFPTVSLRHWCCCVSSMSRILCCIVWKGTVKLSGELKCFSSLSNSSSAAKKKPTRTVKHTSPNRGCFYQQWVLCTLAERVLLSDEAEESITFHPCYRAGRRLSVIPTHDLIAAMIGKGSLWKRCAQSLPGVIPVGLCQELSWPKGWIIWCVTQLVIYFLNNSEFRVKQILWPRTLPHSPPIFLWVTCGAAGKPMLFLSLHSRAGSISLHGSEGEGLFIFDKKFDFIFFKGFENSKCVLTLFICSLLPSHTHWSVHPHCHSMSCQLVCVLLIPDPSLAMWWLRSFHAPYISLHLYMFLISGWKV